MSWPRYLTARHAGAFLALWAVAATVVCLPFVVVIPVQFLWGQPTRWTPLWEALPALLGAGAGALLAPGLATWERLASSRVRLQAALTATAALVMPFALPWLAHFGLPSDARWVDIMFNVLAITAVGLLLASALGPVYGTILAYAAYFGLIVFQHAFPELALGVPFSGVLGNLEAHVWESALLAVAAVFVWTWTLGKSRFATMLARND